MEKMILSDENILKMKNIYSGDNSKVYEKDDGIYKIFSDHYLDINSPLLLKLKLEEADNLDIPRIVLPKSIIYDEYHRIKGVRYSKTGVKYDRRNDDLETYTKRHILVKNTLETASNQKVVLTDFTNYSNIRVNSDGSISVIDYDGMQVGKIPAAGHSSVFFDFWNNNKSIADKYFNRENIYSTDANLLTDEVNIFNSIVFYFADITGINVAALNNYNIEYFLSVIGIEEEEIKRKVLNLFEYCPNEYFTDDEFSMINERYDLEPLPGFEGCKRFVKK